MQYALQENELLTREVLASVFLDVPSLLGAPRRPSLPAKDTFALIRGRPYVSPIKTLLQVGLLSYASRVPKRFLPSPQHAQARS